MRIEDIHRIIYEKMKESLEDYEKDGEVVLYHYSRQDTDSFTARPKYFGKHAFSKREKNTSGVPRVFFYLDPGNREHFFESYTLYQATVPRAAIWSLGDVPEEAKEKIKEQNYGRLEADALLQYVASQVAGFHYKIAGLGEIVAYFEPLTLYRVEDPEALISEAQQDNFQRLMAILRGESDAARRVAILTAENPGGKETSPEQNRENNQALLADLAQAGYRAIPVEGKYGGKEERSFLILGMPRDKAIALGQAYGQEAIVYGQKNNNGGMSFEYIEGAAVADRTDQVRFGNEAQDREDNYSVYAGEKFYIPFFEQT